MKLEHSLNGGYAGLYGEVVTSDCYKLRSLPFIPDIVFDLGANVGVFARFAQQLWPKAQIISVEPHPENIAVYKEHTKGTTLLEVAIGGKNVWHYKGAVNGAHENYITEGVGFSPEDLLKNKDAELVDIPTLSFAAIFGNTVFSWCAKRTRMPLMVLKMDIEGAENFVFADKGSMKCIAEIDYLAFELHDYGETADGCAAVKKLTNQALEQIEKTHVGLRQKANYWALKNSAV